jgi:SAM-dependent methyltransferase
MNEMETADQVINERETAELESFDKLVHDEFGDNFSEEDLKLSDDIMAHHVGLKKAPIMGYRYALYRLKDSDINGENVLNIAAGTGYESIILARKGGRVFAFDISPVSVEIAKKRARVNGLSGRITTEVMSVYQLTYTDNMFEYVYGNACLHHFELEKGLTEIKRVMKKGGKAVFCEPLGSSELFKTIRSLVPIRKNIVSPFERQLNYEDIRAIGKVFSDVRIREFGFFNRLDRLTHNKVILSVLAKLDDLALNIFPFLRRYARSVVIEVIK